MAIDKNDYLDVDGNYDLKKALVDEIIDGANEFDTHKAESVSKVVRVVEPATKTTKTTINLGFKPKHVTINATIINTKYFSISQSDGTTTEALHSIVESDSYFISNHAVILQYNDGNFLTGSVVFTDTGLEITWNLSGVLTGAMGERRLAVSALKY